MRKGYIHRERWRKPPFRCLGTVDGVKDLDVEDDRLDFRRLSVGAVVGLCMGGSDGTAVDGAFVGPNEGWRLLNAGVDVGGIVGEDVA